jgi:hypothetical protein
MGSTLSVFSVLVLKYVYPYRRYIFMRHTLFLGLLLGSTTMQTDQNPLLKSYLWQNRLLLIFSPHDQTELYREQLAELKGQERGMQERDLLVLHVFPDYIILPGGVRLEEEQAQSLRNHFIISKTETLSLLIGKDGTEKLRSRDLLSSQRLFLTLDAMPMRQQEMQQDKLKQ